MRNFQINKYQKRIFESAAKKDARIVMPESDKRIEDAKTKLLDYNITPVLLEEYLHKIDFYIDFISHLEFTDGWTDEMIREYLQVPIHLGSIMVACHDADGMVAGAITSTSEVIRTAIRTVGIKDSSQWVSSIFFMISPDGENAYTFSDCGVIPDPDSEQLVEIAFEAAQLHQLISGEEPRVAFLSFSTLGSANHYRVVRVQDAVNRFGKKYPHIQHEGELQFDAAIIPEIAQMKVPNSVINGKANVLIFPNLDAGNIAYKITERFGGFTALGPLLQGLKKPIHDLSRGCSVNDIISVSAIAAMQKVEYANI